MKTNRNLVLMCVTLFLSAVSAQATPLLQYHFSGDETTELLDSGSLGLNLTKEEQLYGKSNYVYEDVTGPTGYGEAMGFDPAPDRPATLRTALTKTNYDLSNGFVISAWFKAGNDQEATNYPVFFGKHSSFYVGVKDYDTDGTSKVMFRVLSTTDSAEIYFEINALDDAWHYVEASYDPSLMQISLNVDGGTAVTYSDSVLNNVKQYDDKDFVIGSLERAWNNYYGLKGEVDEVTLSAIPEPTTMALLLIGGGCALFKRRRDVDRLQ